MDQSHDGRLKKVARVAEKHDDNNGSSVSSYHVEVMAYHYVQLHPNEGASTEQLVEEFF